MPAQRCTHPHSETACWRLGAQPLIDVRSREVHRQAHLCPNYPEEGLRAVTSHGGAHSVGGATDESGRFRSREVERLYIHKARTTKPSSIARIGEQLQPYLVRAHTPAGQGRCAGYDGSWTEWGNAVRVPIVAGTRRGTRRMTAPASLRAAAEVVSDFISGSRQAGRLCCCQRLPALPSLARSLWAGPRCASLRWRARRRNRCACISSAPAERQPRASSLGPGRRPRRATGRRHRGGAGISTPSWVSCMIYSGMSAMLARIKRHAKRTESRNA